MPSARICRSCLLVTLVFVVPLLQPLNVRSQTNSEWTPGAVPMGSRIGPVAAFPAIKGQPYTAEVLQQRTTVLQDGTRQLAEAHNIYRRESSGRLLDEQLPSPHVKLSGGETFTQHSFVLVDPVRMLSMQWDDDSRTVVVSSIIAPQSTDNFDAPCPAVSAYAKVEQQGLGKLMIHGVDAAGCRTTGVTTGEHPITVVIETWRSQSLHIPLLTTEHESNSTESRMEVTSINLGEPDQTKFEPPIILRTPMEPAIAGGSGAYSRCWSPRVVLYFFSCTYGVLSSLNQTFTPPSTISARRRFKERYLSPPA